MSSNCGQAPDARAHVGALAEKLLRDKSAWTPDQREAAARVATRLVGDVPTSGHCLIGLGGAPGSGKSALAALVCGILERLGSPALVISLDDYYLGRSRRQERARLHPLFSQRGVPGTHDWAALMEHLDRIRAGRIKDLKLPQFDKSSDDLRPQSEFRRLDYAPRVVILEGWLIGAPPQAAEELEQPVNRMEAEHDPDGRWRAQVNERLYSYHRDFKRRRQCCWFLAVPAWDSVIDWRWQQEREAGQSGVPLLLDSREAVSAFLDQFQRISQHMLDTCRHWADRVVSLDRQHVMRIV